MRVLLIGMSGFVSGALTQAALAAGHEVWGLSRGQRPLPSGVTALVADRNDPQAFEQAIASVDVHWDLVVDVIAYQRKHVEQDVAVLRQRADHLVLISTDFVLDPQQVTCFPRSEQSACVSDESSYGGGKVSCEKALANADVGAMRWTILRPCHIYGPGSLLGCLPTHGRDPMLIDRMRAGETLQLVGGGYFLQQPIFVRDLAQVALSCAGNARTHRQTYCVAGPDIIESRHYYQIIADELGTPLVIEELPVAPYAARNPAHRPFLCHRIYSLDRLRQDGLHVPATPIATGLKEHVQAVLHDCSPD